MVICISNCEFNIICETLKITLNPCLVFNKKYNAENTKPQQKISKNKTKKMLFLIII